MRTRSLLGITILLLIALASCGSEAPVATQESPASNITEAPEEMAADVPPAPEPITLRMNSSALTSYAPIFIADAEGFFEDEGITMEYITFNRTTEAVPLIITGDLDIYAGSINAGIFNVLGQEENVKVVADRGYVSSEDTCANHGIMFNKALYDNGELTGPADLKGRVIASSTSGPSGYLLSLYLAQAGLTFDDVTISDVPVAGFIDAMANGTVDAIVAPELRLSQVMNDGNAVLAVSGADVYGDLQSSVVVFGKNLLVDNREAGIRFIRAYMRGIQQYNEGKTDRNVAIMAEYTGETEELLRAACWVTISKDGKINFDKAVSGFQQWSVAQGDLDAPITEQQFWDPSLLEEALAK